MSLTISINVTGSKGDRGDRGLIGGKGEKVFVTSYFWLTFRFWREIYDLLKVS